MNTRRQFILSSAAASAAMALPAADAKPILRIGAISDDHLHSKRPETHRRTKACFDLFRRENVDIVVDTGDIADVSEIGELQLFRKYFDDAFAGTKCVPFFCIANHDYNYIPGTKKNDPVNFENASKALGMSSVNPTAEVNGYQFVNVFQNEPKRDALDKAIAAAVKRNVGNRPIFVVNHVPPMLTTTGTVHWSSDAVRQTMNKYPQIVALTGHIHTAINWAANIWQGEFTAVNLGAHAEYSNKIAGEATILDVFADRIDIRRYEAVSGREIGADDRWSIPWPFDPATAPYRPKEYSARLPRPQLPADAAVTYSQAKNGKSGVLKFSSSMPRSFIYHIQLESKADDGKWTFLGALRWQPPQVMDAPKEWECEIAPQLLDAGRRHRAIITPQDSFELSGKSATFEFDVPANPLKELDASLFQGVRYLSASTYKGKPMQPNAEGWLKKSTWSIMTVLPKALTTELRKHKSATLVFDIGSDQPGNPCTYSIAKFNAGDHELVRGIGGRIYTAPGKFAAHRYAWTISTNRLREGDELCMEIREGGDNASYRINSIKCFV